ncbi:MAG: hypothetical protein OEW58_01775 [Gammaproteobacteria bacterium]|nr:hypothetical protein [Gammaproteobacteria bacterium]
MTIKVLHIVNHPDTLALIKAAGIEGEGLAWRDPLYEGPILAESLETLSEIRAKHFADANWGTFYSIYGNFERRDEALRQFRRFDSVCLWFDHDLLDQLQLLQLLNWFSQQTMSGVRLELVYAGHVRGVFRFTGLENLHPDQIKKLYRDRFDISVNQMDLAARVWKAITADTPKQLMALRDEKMPLLPFLKDAIVRLLEEYPEKETGLSRSERQIAQVVYSGVSLPGAIFEMAQRKEHMPFMNLQACKRILHRMLTCKHPILALKRNTPIPEVRSEDFMRQHFYITNIGFSILAETTDNITLNGIDRWVGGVHIQEGRVWRRDKKQSVLKRTYA